MRDNLYLFGLDAAVFRKETLVPAVFIAVETCGDVAERLVLPVRPREAVLVEARNLGLQRDAGDLVVRRGTELVDELREPQVGAGVFALLIPEIVLYVTQLPWLNRVAVFVDREAVEVPRV